MDAAARTPQPRPESGVTAPTRWTGWFAFLGGGIAWTAHLLLAYAIAEFGCVSGLGRRSAMGISGVAWVVIGVSVVTFAIAAAATVAGYFALQDTDDLGGDPPQTIAGGRYLSRVGVILSAIFALTIVGESLPILWYLQDCGGGIR